MIFVTIVISLLNFYILTHPTDINKNNITCNNIVITYDQTTNLPIIKSLKNAIIEQYFEASDAHTISIEQVSQLTYLVKSHKDMLETPLFYVKIVPVHQPAQKHQEIKKESDPDTFYPIFVPDNLPIVIWIENIIKYKHSNTHTKAIKVIIALHESSIKNMLNK